jgi:AcrR family transcriptional regulator
VTVALRKPTVVRREEIARAVLRIVGERGLKSLTTSTLAAEVGLTNGALYRHFASFDEIWVETVRHGVEQIDATFPDEALPPLDRLLTLAKNRIELLRDEPGLAWLLRSEQAYLVLPEQAAASLRNAARRSRQFLLGALADGAEVGSVRSDIPPEVLLVTVLGTIHALIGRGDPHPSHAGQRPPDPDRVLSGLVRLLEPHGTSSNRRTIESKPTDKERS